MSLTKTKTKTKTKSLNQNIGSFPANGWDYDMEYVVELPLFFENPRWREIPGLQPPPGPDETRAELDLLIQRQNDIAQRELRRPEIEQEKGLDDPPAIRRIMMLSPGGAYPATYMLMHAMIVLGKVVAAHFKSEHMRARPSQLEPRLRPLIDVPGHPAYPSGHALQMFLVAKALSTVVRSHEIGAQLFEIAARVAENREWAGVHYPSDTAAGKLIAFSIFPQAVDAYRDSFRKAAREWL